MEFDAETQKLPREGRSFRFAFSSLPAFPRVLMAMRCATATLHQRQGASQRNPHISFAVSAEVCLIVSLEHMHDLARGTS